MSKRPMTAGQMRAAAGVPEAYPAEGRVPFNPDYVVAPGETLREWREEYAHLPVNAAAKACYDMPIEFYRRIEAGEQPIDDEIAMKLASGTSIPAFLWLNLERQYREGLAAGKRPFADPTTPRPR